MSDNKQAKANVEAKAPEAHYGVETLAEATGASAKDVRRWLRTQARDGGKGDALPGKGGRYAFTQAHVEALARAYGASKARKGSTAAAEAIVAALDA